MMLVSRKKKTLRDREAGMVFRWRGSGSGNAGGLTIAFLVATGVFALAFVGLDVRIAKKRAPGIRSSAEILLLEADDERLALWLDEGSPFPDRFDPGESLEHVGRVDDLLERELNLVSEGDLAWRELPEVEEVLETPRIYKPGELIFPELPDSVVRREDERAAILGIRAEVIGEGAERFPGVTRFLPTEIPAGEYGKQWRWFVTLDERGGVLYCIPVEPVENPFAQRLERWLRVQSFEAGDAKETVEVMVEVIREELGDD